MNQQTKEVFCEIFDNAKNDFENQSGMPWEISKPFEPKRVTTVQSLLFDVPVHHQVEQLKVTSKWVKRKRQVKTLEDKFELQNLGMFHQAKLKRKKVKRQWTNN